MMQSDNMTINNQNNNNSYYNTNNSNNKELKKYKTSLPYTNGSTLPPIKVKLQQHRPPFSTASSPTITKSLSPIIPTAPTQALPSTSSSEYNIPNELKPIKIKFKRWQTSNFNNDNHPYPKHQR
ncbi:unnamed protein product [Cunninghamella blakesleeana]